MLLLAAPSAFASPRLWQPLLLRGAQLPQLLNVPVRRLEVLAVHGGKLAPIPFQVDSMLVGGILSLPQGPVPTVDQLPQALGPSDELSMMMFDLGARAAAAAATPPDALEIAVADPLGGGIRYAYIAAVSDPRRSAVSYVNYEPPAAIIETDHYRLGFRNEFPDELHLPGRNGALSGNLISGFELRGKITVLNLLQFHLTERDVDSRMLAYRAGPIRVIRRVGHRLKVFMGIHSPEVSTVEFFYRDFAQAPFTMRLPLRKLFRDIQGRIAMDFVDLRGYYLLASGLHQPLPIDANTAAAVGETTAADWLAVRGGGRVMLQTFAASAELSAIKRVLYYRADAAGAGGALAAAVGIDTDGWQRLPAGPHRFNPLLISVPEGYGADRAMAEATVAPVVTVRAVSERDSAPSAARSGATQCPAPLNEEGK